MNNEHISQQDWIALFSARKHDIEWMRLQDRVMAHVNGCEQCRELYEKGMALREAAMALTAQPSAPYRGIGSAFQAVASAEATTRATGKPRGRLSVSLDSGSECAVFFEDTLELEGYANKFALNPEVDGRCLLDDDGALRIEIKDGKLLVVIRENEIGGKCLLLADGADDRYASAEPGVEATIELPPDCFCTLVITFSE